MLLKYTIRNITQLEEETRLPFNALLESGKVGDLRKLVKVGMNVNDWDIVDEAITKFFDEGNRLSDLLKHIAKTMENDHFLELGSSEVIAQEIENRKQQIQETLRNTTESKKKQPSK